MTAGCSRKLVDEKGAAVLHTDDSRPLTATTRPTKAHCPLNNPLTHCRMTTINPPSRMRTTVILGHTLSWHLFACGSDKPVPGPGQTLVTF